MIRPITCYLDYRLYLKEWIELRKARCLPASNRWFSQRMGINSSSWLTAVLHEQKGLSAASAERLSAVLKLESSDREYFATLVMFNQASHASEKQKLYEKLRNLQRLKPPKQVSQELYAYYETWYHSAIRSLIGIHTFKNDYEALASLLQPPISTAEARGSVALLKRLGFIRTDETGFYVLSDPAVTSGSYVRSLAIERYQQVTMRLAQKAFDNTDKAERDFSTLTIGISQEKIEPIKQLLSDVRKKISEIANCDAAGDRVYQLNIQLFPMSKPVSSQNRYVP